MKRRSRGVDSGLENFLAHAFPKLQSMGIALSSGLEDSEVTAVEAEFGFTFPADLRLLLQMAMPISDGFPNWRGSEAELRDWMSLLSDRICWDVQHGGFWLSDWGCKPRDEDEAIAFVRERLTQAPPLIPIYCHRYLPSEPPLLGNPVISAYGTDMIYYGYDLASWLSQEFGVERPPWAARQPRAIRDWDRFLQLR